MTLEADTPPTAADRRSALLHDVLVLSRRELRSDHGAAARAYLIDQRRFPEAAIESEAMALS